MRRILVCGGGGFIGGHLVKRLMQEGHWVRSVDIEYHLYSTGDPHEKIIADLRDPRVCFDACEGIDEVYQLAADMGGAGYIFSGENDATIMHNSILCNLNILEAAVRHQVKKVFFSSSACIYPYFNQEDPNNPNCEESSAYPAMPDSEYGWEKLFSERLYQAYSRNFSLDCKIGRFHNVYGPNGAWYGGREKAPAAICRKIAEAPDGSSIDIWGNGLQTRSFLYIDDCIDGMIALMNSNQSGPFNIGSEEMVTIRQLSEMIMDYAGKRLTINYVTGYKGVNGRRSNNVLIRNKIGWGPKVSLEEGIAYTYDWIKDQCLKKKEPGSAMFV
jgi:GDP-D-mannose 3', 5'-epimerase